MNTRKRKRRIYTLFHHRFHGEQLWRSAEEQAWLDVAPVGREFGSWDYERLQILDLYASGQLNRDEVMGKLGVDLKALQHQMWAAGLVVKKDEAT
ncbi:MAG: hypothetical protein Q8O29_05385 [Polaromonas sp.]|uniref:hypothetical protein n=1 Tax=Polaromonas sp. TaxID=1869339 RepID=UPI0027348773|nr:hypothetical protein [Polaromonas sp.]MDP2817703.1 hypothetical protein [Polaromonas sp.]